MSHNAAAFVRVAEVWIPDDDVLRLSSGSYGPYDDFARASFGTTFRRGEGLPGTVWETLRPTVWAELGPKFRRGDEARKAELEAGVGFPVFRGRDLAAIVVLLCGGQGRAGGCLELWEVDPLEELRHVGGYYGNLHEFAELSPLLRFQRGQGLPGITWQRGIPHLLADSRDSEAFVRRSLSKRSGIGPGIGIPLYRAGQVHRVVVMLSAQDTPLARAFEVWVADDADRLVLDAGVYTAGASALEHESRLAVLEPGQGVAGHVLESGLPLAFDLDEASALLQHPTARAAGVGSVVAFPVGDSERTRAVVVLLL